MSLSNQEALDEMRKKAQKGTITLIAKCFWTENSHFAVGIRGMTSFEDAIERLKSTVEADIRAGATFTEIRVLIANRDIRTIEDANL
jgi:hypothetical protein